MNTNIPKCLNPEHHRMECECGWVSARKQAIVLEHVPTNVDFVVTPSVVKLTLWEIKYDSPLHDSPLRAYAWAESPNEAIKLFRIANPDRDYGDVEVLLLFPIDAKPFCTKLSDEGWEI